VSIGGGEFTAERGGEPRENPLHEYPRNADGCAEPHSQSRSSGCVWMGGGDGPR
jgi:hypothetical protein